MPDPSEIIALEVNAEFRRSAFCSVSQTIDIDWSIFLGVLRKSGVSSLPKKTVSDREVRRPSVVWPSRRTRLRQASPATCRASVARYGKSREKRRVRGEPAGYELREE